MRPIIIKSKVLKLIVVNAKGRTMATTACAYLKWTYTLNNLIKISCFYIYINFSIKVRKYNMIKF